MDFTYTKTVLNRLLVEAISDYTAEELKEEIEFELEKIKMLEKKVIPVELPVILQKGEFSELKNFMANSTARISDRNKWIVFDDNYWFVYEQEYGKRVKKILETENFLEALALLSK